MMRKTLDIFTAGDRLDVETAAGDTLEDVSLWTLDAFGITVAHENGETLNFLPWGSVDRLTAFKAHSVRGKVAP